MRNYTSKLVRVIFLLFSLSVEKGEFLLLVIDIFINLQLEKMYPGFVTVLEKYCLLSKTLFSHHNL